MNHTSRLRCQGVLALAGGLCVLVALASSHPAARQLPIGDAKAVFEGNAASSGWLPLDLHRDRYLYVRGRVNGRETDMVVDSGAGATVLELGLATSLGLRLEGGVSARGVGGAVPAQMARGVDLELGALRLSLPAVVVIDLRRVQDQVGREMPVIVGQELFRRTIVDVDYPLHRIAFHAPTADRPASRAVVLPLYVDQARYQVDGQLEGLPPARFELDTGASDTLVVFRAYTETHRLLDGRAPVSTREIGGVGGSTIVHLSTVRQFVLGSEQLNGVPAVFHDSGKGAFETRRAAGLIGGGLLSRYRTVFDVPGRRLVLGPPGKPNGPFQRDRLGLQVVRDGTALKVQHVAAGSPADRDGWRAGDKVVALNAQPIPADFWAPWKHVVSGASGQPVTLRDGRGKDHRLVLADYY